MDEDPRGQPRYDWRNLVRNLHTWKRGGQRAVHKPLLTLMILAAQDRGDGNRFRFRDLEDLLRRLLVQFGPHRKSYHPEFPFWHLQSDRFWRIEGAESMGLRKGGSSPSKGTLLASDACARVDAAMWDALARDPGLRDELVTTILFDFWPESQHLAIRNALGLRDRSEELVTRAKRNPQFRDDVLRAYGYRCCVCGYDGRISGALFGLEAAHVRWHAYAGADHVSNGLALCAQHHIALDSGVITVDDDLCLLVSADLTGGPQLDGLFYRHEGKTLLLCGANVLVRGRPPGRPVISPS